MTGGWKAVALALAAVLLIGLGAAGGAWLSSKRYTLQLKDQGDKLVACNLARDNVLALVTEQGAKLGELANQAEQRQASAAQAVADVQQQADQHYAAAQRLQQERAEGDQCSAAEAIIDKELGL